MKQVEAIKAYKSLITLSREKLPFEMAFVLYEKKNELKSVFEFQVEQERKLAETFNASIDENGFFHTKKQDDMPALQKELEALRNCEVKTIKQIEIIVPDDVKISMDDLEALGPVIRFKRG